MSISFTPFQTKLIHALVEQGIQLDLATSLVERGTFAWRDIDDESVDRLVTDYARSIAQLRGSFISLGIPDETFMGITDQIEKSIGK